jgi:hypothetical protein
MENTRKKENLSIAFRALTAAVPYIGGTINSLWTDIVAQRKEDRFRELINSLESEINRIETINQTFVTHDDFLDLFENISRHVVNERDITKRKLYKNLILSSAKDSEADFDKTEKYIRLMENISTIDTLILKIFLNPKKFNEEIGTPVQSKNSDNRAFTHWEVTTVKEILTRLIPSVSLDDIIDSLDFLERNRLLITHNGDDSLNTNGNPIQLLENKITEKGKSFIKYITNEN